ncbi:MAG: hypothetical protein K0S29_1123 [Gammaproteobacteria bacterium]|jgi:predicted acetyltransferase|nr:hypothetical protein [Gammaproteobacteria bacterium]
MLLTQKTMLIESNGFSGWHALARTWQEASVGKKFVMLGGAIFALSAVAVGVGLALGFGVPPQSTIEAMKYAYEGFSAAKHIYNAARGLFNAVSQYFSKDTKTEQGRITTVVPFMQTMQQAKFAEQSLAAQAA